MTKSSIRQEENKNKSISELTGSILRHIVTNKSYQHEVKQEPSASENNFKTFASASIAPHKFVSTVKEFKWTKRMILLMNSLMHANVTKKKWTAPTQHSLGNDIDTDRSYTNKLLHKLQEAGFIKIHNRGYNTCLYLVNEQFYKSIRTSIASMFGILGLMAMFLNTSISGSGSRSSYYTHNLEYKKDNIYLSYSSYLLTIERDSLGHEILEDFSKKCKRDKIKMFISGTAKQIAVDLGFTEAGMLSMVAFNDYEDVLLQAYNDYRKHKTLILNPCTWIWAQARRILEKKGLKPNVELMNRRLTLAGYKKGDKLLIDQEAQPTYRDTKKKEETQTTLFSDSYLKQVVYESDNEDDCIEYEEYNLPKKDKHYPKTKPKPAKKSYEEMLKESQERQREKNREHALLKQNAIAEYQKTDSSSMIAKDFGKELSGSNSFLSRFSVPQWVKDNSPT